MYAFLCLAMGIKRGKEPLWDRVVTTVVIRENMCQKLDSFGQTSP